MKEFSVRLVGSNPRKGKRWAIDESPKLHIHVLLSSLSPALLLSPSSSSLPTTSRRLKLTRLIAGRLNVVWHADPVFGPAKRAEGRSKRNHFEGRQGLERPTPNTLSSASALHSSPPSRDCVFALAGEKTDGPSPAHRATGGKSIKRTSRLGRLSFFPPSPSPFLKSSSPALRHRHVCSHSQGQRGL